MYLGYQILNKSKINKLLLKVTTLLKAQTTKECFVQIVSFIKSETEKSQIAVSTAAHSLK